MKNTVTVILNTDIRDTIQIGKDPSAKFEYGGLHPVLADMSTLCEGLCTLIHVADQNNIKPSAQSLRDCIRHLEKGFADATYKGINLKDSPHTLGLRDDSPDYPDDALGGRDALGS